MAAMDVDHRERRPHHPRQFKSRDASGERLGVALVPWPVELGDEITLGDDAWPWPFEIIDVVWAPAGAKVAAIVKVRPAVLHPV